jgi:hypothetical protein
MGTAEARALRLVGAAIATFSGCVLVASLFVGWYSDATVCEFGLCPARTVTGWQASGAARWLLLAVALAAPVPLIAEWLPARTAVAAAGTPYPGRVDPFVRARVPVGYAPGYYVCLGAAGFIVLAGVSAALAGRDE